MKRGVVIGSVWSTKHVEALPRGGLLEIEMEGGDGRVVATFRGASRTIGGTHFDEDEEEEENR